MGALDDLMKPGAAAPAPAVAAPTGGGALDALMTGAKKNVSRLAQGLDFQRNLVAQKAGLGATSDEQMTNLRKKIGVEQSYQDPKLFGVIPQPHWLHHAEQGLEDAALGTLTDPLTIETLGAGPALKAVGKGLPTLGKVAEHTDLQPLYDFFTHGGPAKRAQGVETVENVLGAKGKVLTQGQATAQRYSKPIEAAMGKLAPESKVRVARWMDGQLPLDQLSAEEQAAAKRMDRWRKSMHKVDVASAPGGEASVGTRGENYFPGIHEEGAGAPAHSLNLLKQSAAHLMQREGQHVIPPDATAEQVMEALQGRAQSGARMATSRRLEQEVRKTLGLKAGEEVPPEISDLFNINVRATGAARTPAEKWADRRRTVVTAPKAAVVGTGPRHMANIASLALGQPGGIQATARALPTFAKLLAKPQDRNALLKSGINLGAIEPNPERTTGVIEMLKNLPGPLSLPGKAMDVSNRATWSFDDAMAQALAEQNVKRGMKGYAAGRAARRGLVDYENLSPFAEKAKAVMPFAAFNTSLPKAVASGVLADPMRAAFLSRATGGAMYGSDYDTPMGRMRSYLPTADVGRAEPVKFARKSLSQAVTIPASAAASGVAREIGLKPPPWANAKAKQQLKNKVNYLTYGQDPLDPKDAKSLLLQLLLSGVPYGRQGLQQTGLGAFKPQSLQDYLLQSAGGQLPLR